MTMKYSPERLLEDVRAALWTMPTATIIKTNQTIYTMVAVILQMLGYKMNSQKEQNPPWRRRLEVKIKAVQREVCQISKLWKEVIKKGMPKSTTSCRNLRS